MTSSTPTRAIEQSFSISAFRRHTESGEVGPFEKPSLGG
jgi:hypothetical protein